MDMVGYYVYVKILGLDWFDNGMSIYMLVYITRRLCLDRNGVVVHQSSLSGPTYIWRKLKN